MPATTKDPITCHILDTATGRPAKGVVVTLEGPCVVSNTTTTSSSSSSYSSAPSRSAAAAPAVFEAVTDDDGRIRVWQPAVRNEASAAGLGPLLDRLEAPSSRWTLRFDTGGYFGEENTFFPEAIVVFRVQRGQAYHVPLLLSPYSYTTYRGS